MKRFMGVGVGEVDDCENWGDVKGEVGKIQHEVFDWGGELGRVSEDRRYRLRERCIWGLEEWIEG